MFKHHIFKKHECLDCRVIQQTYEVGLCLPCRSKLSKFRVRCKLQMQKWRKANPKYAKVLGAKHQQTWRTKNPVLNRLRAKLGLAKVKERLKCKQD